MAYTRIKQQDHNNTQYTEFVVDNESEIVTVPTDPSECSVGSVALCIDSGEVYMLNSQRKWVKI